MPRTRRASPRYLRFLLTGATVGLVVTVVVVLLRGDQVERPAVLFFYLGLLLVGIGGLLGGLVAVVLTGKTADPSTGKAAHPSAGKTADPPDGVPGPPTSSP